MPYRRGMVRLKVDVIVTATNRMTQQMRAVTSTIPHWSHARFRS
jgi:hypothetical protein